MTDSQVLLPLLGSRQYLHGTTLYQHLIADIPADATVCFRIAQMIESNCIRILRKSDGATSHDASAQLDWEVSGHKDTIWVEARPQVHPIERRAYEERLILERARLASGAAFFEGASPFNWLATAIPMFKAILADNVSAHPMGKWLFVRLDGYGGRRDFANLELRLVMRRAGILAKSKVLLDGKDFGELYFSWAAE
jgi:hypothetical protein